jgi:tRNA-dihydrouridine synthase
VPLTARMRGGWQEDDDEVAERTDAAAAAGGGAASGVTARRSQDGSNTPYGGPLVEQLNSIASSLRRGFKVTAALSRWVR